VDVEARADVRARPESPGAAAIARREESRQWPRVVCSCLVVAWLVADGPGAVSSKESAGPCGGAEGGVWAPQE
jgi:hypothetical protein